MIIIGQHRNLRLAHRHRAQLRRDYAPRSVEIISRRNERGRFSVRGQFFVFEVGENQEPKTLELVVHFDYAGGKEPRKVLRFQVHVFVPVGLKDREIVSTIREAVAHDDTNDTSTISGLPEGWQVRTIYWGKVLPETKTFVKRRASDIGPMLRKQVFGGGSSKAYRRKTNCRSRKGTTTK